MNPELNDDQERLLAAVLAGEIDASAEDVRAAQQDPEFRLALRALTETAALVDAAASAEAQALEGARAGSAAPGGDRVHAVLRAAAASSGSRLGPADPPAVAGALAARRREIAPRLFVGLSVAVALFLAYLVSPFNDGGTAATSAGTTPLLGSELVACLHPLGPVAAFDELRWRRPEGGWVTLIVRARSDERELLRLERRRVNSWSDPNAVRSWPDAIRWSVRAYDATGAFIAAAEGEAERKP